MLSRSLRDSEFRVAWPIILLGVVGVFTSMSAALLYGFGALVVPLEDAFGWSREEITTSITFLFAGVAVGSQIVGWLFIRFGMRRVAIFSVLFQSIGYFLITQIQTSIGWLYLAFFIMPIICSGTIAITWAQLVNLWYVRNRGLALAIIFSATGLAAMIMPSAITWAISWGGWKAAFVLLGAIPLLLTLPLTLLWMKFPQVYATESKGEGSALEIPGIPFRQALKSRVFLGYNIAFTLSVALTVGMVTNAVPLLQDMGLSAATASAVFSSFGVSMVVGRLLVGFIIDRYRPTVVAIVSLALPMAGCLIFLHAGSGDIYLLIMATALIGFSAGAEFDLAAFLIARYFGLKDYARIFGLHLGLITIIAGGMPAWFGYLYGTYGNYTPVLWFCFACSFITTLVLFLMKDIPAYAATAAPKGTELSAGQVTQ